MAGEPNYPWAREAQNLMSIRWRPLIPGRRATLTTPGERPGGTPSDAGRAADCRRGPVGPGSPSPDGSTESTIPPALFSRPTSVFVYGPSRPLVNLAIFALAEATTPKFQWLDIGIPGEERLPMDPVRLGWVRDDQLWPVGSPTAFRPDPSCENPPVTELIRADEAAATVAQLRDFVRLPETSQRILATPPPPDAPGVVAVPNAHRIMSTVPVDRVPSILRVHRIAGYSVYIGFAEAAGDTRAAYDFVYRIEGEAFSDWRNAKLVCERYGGRAMPRGSAGEPLAAVPLFASVLNRASAAIGRGNSDPVPPAVRPRR